MPSLMGPATFVVRAFLLSFFSFATVLLGALLLVTLPQVRETVDAFSGPSQVVCFLVAEFYWALCAWYCARLVLQKRFAPFDPLLPCSRPAFAARVISWAPRTLGFLAMAPLTVSIAWSQRIRDTAPWFWLLPAGVATLFIAFVVFRTKLFPELVDYHDQLEPGYRYKRFDRINRVGWRLLGGLAAVPIVIFLALIFGPRAVGRWLGTPAIVLFAFGSWNLSAGFSLVYLPLSRGWAALTAYPLLFAGLFSWWVENHNTPIGPPPSAALAEPREAHPTIQEQWTNWLTAVDSGECRGRPVYLVASAGGASRAAFWTGELLATLEEHARSEAGRTGEPACFAKNIFAISAVSGGSLGAATFVSLLADEQARGARYADLRGPTRAFLEQDMLAPVAGYLFFQDFVQRFLPVSIPRWDRSRGLELTWTDDWRDLEAGRTGAGGPGGAPAAAPAPNWFGLPLKTLYAGGRQHALPSLFLNTTRVSDGRRVLQSNVRFAPDDMYDLFSEGFLTSTLTLAGAVHNSSRFSYVSPAGLAWKLNGAGAPAPWGYLVDGGYFENSGAATLAEIVQTIAPEDRQRLTLILISNDPSEGRKDYVCAAGAGVGPALEDPPSSLATELLAPPLALYNARTARAHAADMAAVRLLGRDAPARVFELRLPRVDHHVPPMTWFVSPDIGADMDGFIDHAPDDDGGRLWANLRVLRDYIVATSVRPSSPCSGLMGPAPVGPATRGDARGR